MDRQIADLLHTLRRAFSREPGEQFETMFLYGSRAREEARPDSDVDVLVVVNGPFDYEDLIQRTSDVVSALSLEHGLVISRAFVSVEQFARERSPFLLNVRREAVPA